MWISLAEQHWLLFDAMRATLAFLPSYTEGRKHIHLGRPLISPLSSSATLTLIRFLLQYSLSLERLSFIESPGPGLDLGACSRSPHRSKGSAAAASDGNTRRCCFLCQRFNTVYCSVDCMAAISTRCGDCGSDGNSSSGSRCDSGTTVATGTLPPRLWPARLHSHPWSSYGLRSTA